MTVEIQERFVTTVVFECFPAQIAVAGADFVESNCHQTNEKRQKLQYLKNFFIFLLSVQENHLLNRQYEKYLLVSVLPFYIALAVVNPKSKLGTVISVHGRQFLREFSCSLLSTKQSYVQKASLHC